MEESLQNMLKMEYKEEEDIIEEPQPQKQENIKKTRTVGLIGLSDWFTKYKLNLKDMGIGFLSLNVRDVDPNESLLFTIPHPNNKSSGDSKKKLRLFDNAVSSLIPDLVNHSIRDLGSSLFVSQTYDDSIIIRSYIRSGVLICTSCCNIDNMVIPMSIHKVKRKDKSLEFIEYPLDYIEGLLDKSIDKEILEIMYQQSRKHISELNTFKDVIQWFEKKIPDINDINHLLLIDDIISTLIDKSE